MRLVLLLWNIGIRTIETSFEHQIAFAVVTLHCSRKHSQNLPAKNLAKFE